MSQYGRNFEFRIPPEGEHRDGRNYIASNGSAIVIGAPVAKGAVDSMGRAVVTVVDGDTQPVVGKHGILVYEAGGPDSFAGYDPALLTLSDIDKAPVGAAVQVVHGTGVKVVLRNTAAQTFFGVRSYAARNMVSPANLSGISVGDQLRPQASPDDTDGYGVKVAGAEKPWLTVTAVDTTRGEVEAVMVF